MADIKRPSFLRSNLLDELLRWCKHTTDNIDLLNDPQYVDFRKSADQVLTTGVETTVTWDVPRTAVGSLISVASTGKITLSAGGIYLFTGTAAITANITGVRRCYFTKNGLNTTTGHRFGQVSTGDTALVAVRMTASVPILVADGDYIEFVAFQNSGGNLNLLANATGECALQITRLR